MNYFEKCFFRTLMFVALTISSLSAYAGELKFVVGEVEATFSSDVFATATNDSVKNASSLVFSGDWTGAQVRNALLSITKNSTILKSVDMGEANITDELDLSAKGTTYSAVGPLCNKKNLAKVVLPKEGFTVTSLYTAFYGDYALKVIENIEKIKGKDVDMSYAYTGVKFTNFVFPSLDQFSFTSLDHAFWSCTELTEVTMPSEQFTTTNFEYVFSACGKLAKINNLDKLYGDGMSFSSSFTSCAFTEFTFPESCLKVKNLSYTFSKCSKLTSVTNFDKLQSESAVDMSNCFQESGIKNLTFPESGFKVGSLKGTFNSCQQLTTVTFPTDYTPTTWQETFKSCTKLTELVNFEKAKGTGVFYSTFDNCTSLEEVTLPAANTTVSSLYRTFFQCHKLKVINNFDKLKSQANGATMEGTFYCCDSLKTVTMPTEGFVISSLKQTFSNCSKLPYVDLSKIKFNNTGSFTMQECFYNCSRLQEVDLPSGGIVITMPTYSSYTYSDALYATFAHCYQLAKISNFDKITCATENILRLQYTFAGCCSLTQVEFGFKPNVIYGAYKVFGDKSDATSVYVVPNDVNIVKVFPLGTTEEDVANSCENFKKYFGTNICAKTGEGTAKLIGDEFKFVRRGLENPLGKLPARYFSTYEIDLNGKKASYIDMQSNTKWNTFMCPFAPTEIYVSGTEAYTADNKVAIEPILKNLDKNEICVGLFKNLYKEMKDAPAEVNSVFRCQDSIMANTPYVYRAGASGVVSFVNPAATETVAKTETEFTTLVDDATADVTPEAGRNAQSRIRLLTADATASEPKMGGHIGSYQLVEGASYLNELGTGFVKYENGKWDNEVLGGDFMYNGDMYVMDVTEGKDIAVIEYELDGGMYQRSVTNSKATETKDVSWYSEDGITENPEELSADDLKDLSYDTPANLGTKTNQVGEDLVIANTCNRYAYLEVNLVPDNITVYNSAYVVVYNAAGEVISYKLVNGTESGVDSASTDDVVWFDENGAPKPVSLRFTIGNRLNNNTTDQTIAETGKIVTYVVSAPLEGDITTDALNAAAVYSVTQTVKADKSIVTGIDGVKSNTGLKIVSLGANTVKFVATAGEAMPVKVYNVLGQLAADIVVDGEEIITLPQGVYVAGGQKFVVK